MYRINIIKSNCAVRVGPRYVLSKKSAKELIETFLFFKCEISVEKLTRVHDIFMWDSENTKDKVLAYFLEKKYGAV